MRCRARGRVTIEEAVEIGIQMGIFEDEDIEIVQYRDRKQQVRLIFGRVMDDGERVIRSIRAGDEIFYVDLTSTTNSLALNLLIKAEEDRIIKAQKKLKSLRKIKAQMEGQLKLEGFDEYYADAL